MSETDRDALTRAMEMARRDPDRAEQLDAMVAESGWQEAAEFSAYCMQGRALRLKPWESPPLCFAENDEGDEPGRVLLRKMLDAGLSRYEPDPLTALEKPTTGK
jgi:hypothetical protein